MLPRIYILQTTAWTAVSQPIHVFRHNERGACGGLRNVTTLFIPLFTPRPRVLPVATVGLPWLSSLTQVTVPITSIILRKLQNCQKSRREFALGVCLSVERYWARSHLQVQWALLQCAIFEPAQRSRITSAT